MSYNNFTSGIILHLSLIEGIGFATVSRIINKIGIENLDQLYHMNIGQLVRTIECSEIIAKKIVDGLATRTLLEQELTLLEKHPVSLITFLDPEYPELLKNIQGPPLVLYYQGILPTTYATLAVIGSRDAHSYAQDAINRLVPPLVNHGWAIISGGARGADTMAHRATLDAGGITVAILGSGLLRPYPYSNKNLFAEMIQKGGAVVSPFPLLMEPLAPNFPARNRIIAGMSRGCLVVQAAVKSGARITADFCLAQGREVFAVPGPINDPLSQGCHALIQQGAKLTTDIADIVSEFGQELIIPATHTLPLPGIVLQKTPATLTNSVEDKIVRACRAPCSFDELLELTGVPMIEITQLLFNLQLQGKITQTMSGLWEGHKN